MAEAEKKQEVEKDEVDFEIEGDEVELKVEDDTPEEDRNRSPMPKEIVEELENDELDNYSDGVKERLKQMKKVWHDERRAKESAMREQQQALDMAKKAMEENKRLRAEAEKGRETYIDTARQSLEYEMEMAKRAYKEAYESGDTDSIVEAQSKLSDVNWKRQQLSSYQKPRQTEENSVNTQSTEPQRPQLDAKTMAWQERNTWYGSDPEMTSSALGLHQKLIQTKGEAYVGTDEYWADVDKTMRRRFPEYFGEEESTDGGGKPVRAENKPATVVAPASRSTSSKRVVLKQSQVALAKKLGLTPEQYAKEMKRLENQNG
jgi:hypothetical protein